MACMGPLTLLHRAECCRRWICLGHSLTISCLSLSEAATQMPIHCAIIWVQILTAGSAPSRNWMAMADVEHCPGRPKAACPACLLRKLMLLGATPMAEAPKVAVGHRFVLWSLYASLLYRLRTLSF